MLGKMARRVFGSANDRFINRQRKIVSKINDLEESWQKLSDDEIRQKTIEFKARLEKGETLEDILPEAFATVREGAKRSLNQRHYDVQLLGGIVQNMGMISEMRTGEGKTLVSTLATYLNAVSGKGVHVVTVNDYLAKRDAEWMGQVYNFLGLSVGIIVHGLSDEERRTAYAADITYGTNNEFGFDYLRDNMKFRLEDRVQRDFNFAIVDEVDSILIDEARTPLIISGPAESSSQLYGAVDALIPHLSEEHYEMDEKNRSITLTDEGVEKIEELLRENNMLDQGSMYDVHNISLVHHINQALKAHKLFTRDKDYIVNEDRIVIIDEFTGRMMEGRRFSEGLHQALEAKEKVSIQMENQTLASITFQNYFRLYPKLAGMTGTAMTEAGEFQEIYNLEVREIPTHRDIARLDEDDEVYRTSGEKWDAIIELIRDCQSRKQPVLVGTVSIEKSEMLSSLLTKAKIKHNVLNARQHQKEAEIIAFAGCPEAVTIATNMAGRGTDIKLGGNLEMILSQAITDKMSDADIQEMTEKLTAENAALEAEVKKSGGLYVIGTERHESRRIDNQLRGRSGRQGDPGQSKFFLSLEDDLMRIFGSERMDGMLRRLGLEDGEAIVHPWINKALEKAQTKVEARNFDIRKQLLKYDDVMNDQRKVIYEQRIELMAADELSETVQDMRLEVLDNLIARTIPANAYAEQWEVDSLHEECLRLFAVDLPIKDWAAEEGIADLELKERIQKAAEQAYAAKVANYGPDIMRQVEKSILLRLLDQLWKDHLLSLDHLRQGINLRAYAQRDPLHEYKREAFELFENMLIRLREDVVNILSHVQLQPNDAAAANLMAEQAEEAAQQPMHENRQEAEEQSATAGGQKKPARNAPCPCGSGKKYKHCHGKIA